MARQRAGRRGTLSESRSAPLEQSTGVANGRPNPPTATLYACPQLPGRWVGTDEHGALVHWPAVAGGWAERTPYTGRRALRVVDPAEARGTGWPGGGGGRRRLAGAERGQPFTFRLDDPRRAALQKLAEKQGQQPSDTVREAIDLAIARGSTR